MSAAFSLHLETLRLDQDAEGYKDPDERERVLAFGKHCRRHPVRAAVRSMVYSAREFARGPWVDNEPTLVDPPRVNAKPIDQYDLCGCRCHHPNREHGHHTFYCPLATSDDAATRARLASDLESPL